MILSRAGRTVRYPAEFQLVAAMNPCPCGFLGDPRRACLCGDEQLLRYRRRVSGPLLDRIDLHVDVPAVPCEGCRGRHGEGTAEVAFASASRAAPGGARLVNARLRGGALRRHCALDPAAREVLTRAVQRLGLSARAHDRDSSGGANHRRPRGRGARRRAPPAGGRPVPRPRSSGDNGGTMSKVVGEAEGARPGGGRHREAVRQGEHHAARGGGGGAAGAGHPLRLHRARPGARAWGATRAAGSSRSSDPSPRGRPRWRSTPSPRRSRPGGVAAFIDAEHALDVELRPEARA